VAWYPACNMHADFDTCTSSSSLPSWLPLTLCPACSPYPLCCAVLPYSTACFLPAGPARYRVQRVLPHLLPESVEYTFAAPEAETWWRFHEVQSLHPLQGGATRHSRFEQQTNPVREAGDLAQVQGALEGERSIRPPRKEQPLPVAIAQYFPVQPPRSKSV